MTTVLRFELDARAADRVIDLAFGENRARIESSGEGFNSYSIACGLVGDDAGEAMTLAQVICCIAYHCFIDDDNLRRPPGCQFHKALLAAVVGSWDSEPGVAAEVNHHAALGLRLKGQPRIAEWIYPEVEDRWEASRDALQGALEQLVEMGNEILPVMTAYAAQSSLGA